MSSSPEFSTWRPHPWHGLDVGPDPPHLVSVYLETGPFDLVKYEIDKETGYLRVDRPHHSSSQNPALYGFIPKTYCADRVRELMPQAAQGDADPLDVSVVSERPITRAEVMVTARVVGGLPMLDNHEADDKIIAVLENDPIWSGVQELADLPPALIDRLVHYFMTYKLLPEDQAEVSIGEPYDRAHAEAVIQAAIEDYQEHFGG